MNPAANRCLLGALSVLAAALLAPCAVAQTILAQSTFDSDVEGWEIRTNASGCAIGSLVTRTALHVGAGGNPGGFIQHVDPREGRTGYFRSPSKSAFAGDLAAAYGGVLAFDLRQSDTTSQYDNPDVVLVGGGLTLVFDTPYNPRLTWTAFGVPLISGAGWRVASCDGPPATEAELRQALAAVDYWLIRCEFRDGADTDGMDNVSIITDLPKTPWPESTFDTGIEGWWVEADAQVSWDAAGGVPGGCLRADDAAVGAFYAFLAPAKFLGDHAGAMGMTLEFDLRASPAVDDFPAMPLALLSNGQLELGFVQHLPIAGDTWRHHTIPLTTGAGWVRTSDGQAATAAEIEAVLSALWRLEIRGEFRDGDEVERLDNVRLGSCRPSAIALPVLTEPCTGEDVSLSVVTGGQMPMTYQWRRNGTPIALAQNPTAHSPTLVIESAGRNDNGVYTCVVTNACGEATSNAATVAYCITDVNCDGVVNSTDVSDFINTWFEDQAAGTLHADWDDNGVSNSTDVSDFINDWFAESATACAS